MSRLCPYSDLGVDALLALQCTFHRHGSLSVVLLWVREVKLRVAKSIFYARFRKIHESRDKTTVHRQTRNEGDWEGGGGGGALPHILLMPFFWIPTNLFRVSKGGGGAVGGGGLGKVCAEIAPVRYAKEVTVDNGQKSSAVSRNDRTGPAQPVSVYCESNWSSGLVFLWVPNRSSLYTVCE